MPIIARSESKSSIPQIKPGSYPARCYGVVLLGTTYNEMYEKLQEKVLIQFEFPSECIDAPENPDIHGKPYVMSRTYTLSLHEKAALREDLERWRNKPFTAEELLGFDLKHIIGAPCMVAIKKSKTGKSKVDAVSAVPHGMSVAPQVNPTVYFDLDDFTHFDDLYDWIKKEIRASNEYKERFNSADGQAQGMDEPPVDFDEDQDIPF
jgi:hypothetical protein